MAYKTGNPLGSVDPRDLYDNAENLDKAVNDRSKRTWVDRFGKTRLTYMGLEQELIAVGAGNIYTSITQGRSATTSGDIFWVLPEGADELDYLSAFKNKGASATPELVYEFISLNAVTIEEGEVWNG